MPNRIIKESIRTSKSINALNDFQFRLWTYLITYVDDYGRGSADPEILKGFVFPRRKRVTESDIEKTLAELAGMGCIHLYKIDGESYFCFPNWGDHQRIQTKKSKFPEPPTAENDSSQNPTVNHGELPPESNPNPNPESESEPASEHERNIFEVIAYLNAKANKRYDCKVAKNQEHISGRLNEGRTVEELKYVIDVKCEEWLESAEFNKNLNPVTLFRPSNFDRYVNQNLKNPPDAAPGEPAKTESDDLRSWQN